MRSFLSFTIIAFNSLELTLVSDVLLLILLGWGGGYRSVSERTSVCRRSVCPCARLCVCVFVCIVFRMFRKMTNG